MCEDWALQAPGEGGGVGLTLGGGGEFKVLSALPFRGSPGDSAKIGLSGEHTPQKLENTSVLC